MTVEVRDLFHLYPTGHGHVAALRGLTLDVAPGERVVIHGPNGSGKTTLMRVLAGESDPSAGTVRVCGVDLAGAGERSRRMLRSRRLGLVDQHHGRTLRPELSTVDNVALQLRLARMRRVPARVRAAQLLDRLGLGHLAGRPPASLSAGEAQQVAVCAAVAHGPALVLADEPTGQLDRDTADQVYDLLVAATEGATLVLVTHDVQATRVADRIVRIRDGRLSEEWTPDDTGDERLVVDDRGWLRLPEPLRVQTGVASRVRAAAGAGSIVLTPTAPPADAGPAAAGHVARVPGEPVVRAEVTVDLGGRRVLDGVRLAVPARLPRALLVERLHVLVGHREARAHRRVDGLDAQDLPLHVLAERRQRRQPARGRPHNFAATINHRAQRTHMIHRGMDGIECFRPLIGHLVAAETIS